MERSALVLLAQGCEELEAVTVVDLLRRAGVEVVTAGLDDQLVKASRGTVLKPDAALDQVLRREFDMVVLPGGLPGADNLAADRRVMDLLVRMAKEGKYTCAICAAPTVLAKAGLLEGKRATGYPGMLEGMHLPHTSVTGEAVEWDERVITSRGPGTAMDFALTMVEALMDSQTRQKVEKALVR